MTSRLARSLTVVLLPAAILAGCGEDSDIPRVSKVQELVDDRINDSEPRAQVRALSCIETGDYTFRCSTTLSVGKSPNARTRATDFEVRFSEDGKKFVLNGLELP